MIKIAIVQTKLFWEDGNLNRSHLSDQINSIEADVIVFPEMFTSGFTMNVAQVAEDMQGTTINWMKEIAKKKNAVFTGSLVIKEGGKYYNRMLWIGPDGELEYYDKRHLFRMANEQEYYSDGKRKVVVAYKGFRFCLQVCYDLRFPVWSRNIGENGESPIYDCLIYVANWPEIRRTAWTSLLQARAIENQCFVIGVNRVGQDGKGIVYSGDSAVYSPKGDKISTVEPYEENVEIVEIEINELNDFREKFPVGMDADAFRIMNM